jgi:hypothetical protein
LIFLGRTLTEAIPPRSAPKGERTMTRLSTNKNNHPSNVITRIQDLIAGFQKIASTEQFDVLGTVSAQPALVTELQGLLVPWTSAEDAELAAKKAREARNAVETSTVKRLAAIEESVVSHYGKTSPDLVAFGLSPTKPRKKQSPDERAASAEKAARTRAARKAAMKATATPPPTTTTK